MVLADGPAGYARLARAISRGQMAGEKGAPRFTLEELAEAGRAALVGAHRLPQGRGAGRAGRPTARRRRPGSCSGWSRPFGRDQVAVELWDHGDPLDSARNDALAELAVRPASRCVATNNAHYATPARRPLATALAAVRARRSLDELDGGCRRPAAPTCARGPSRPAASPATRAWSSAAAELGRACAFDLALVAPELPPFPCPAGPRPR